jgi:transketolase
MVEISLRDVFGDYLVAKGKEQSEIIVIDADLSSSTRTNKFAKAYPNRFFNMGIAEQNMIGVALGFAISGKIPVVSGFSIFTTGRAWEFIRLACHDNLNVKIITTHGGIVGEDGSTHNALEDLSITASLPNLTVLVPSDNIELIKILDYLFRTKGTFYVRLPRGSFPKIHSDNYKFDLGKPDILKEGKDICLIGTGYGSVLALESYKTIEKQLNLSIKIINLPTVKPIDEKSLLDEIKNIKAIIVLEEHNTYCGFGSIIARIISERLEKIIKVIGINNIFAQSGKRQTVLNAYRFNKQEIIKQIRNITI